MKKFLTILTVIAASLFVLSGSADAKSKAEVHEAVFQTNLHCKNCAAKIVDNVSFEKGVKDMKTDVENKTVTIVYDAKKTTTVKLCDAIRKLGYKAELIGDKIL